MADNKDPLGILQEQSAAHDPLGILSTDAEKKNTSPSSSDAGSLELESTESPSESEIPSTLKTPTKEDNIATVKAGQIDALKTKTRDQFVNNPIFADSNPNAQRNRNIYFNNLHSKGYSLNQLHALKVAADKAIQSKRLVDKNAPKVNQNPGDVEASYNTAVGLTGMGKYDEAINLFNATLGHLKPGEEGPANSLQQDNMAMNIVTKKSAATNPSNSLYGIGYVLSSKKDYEGSIDYYNQALEADPNNVNAHKGLAYSKHQLGLKEEARQHLNEAKKIEQNNRSNEALVGQIEEKAAGERDQQRVSEQMASTADALEAFALGDPEGKLGNLGYLNPVGKWYSGLVSGEKTIGKGLKEMSEGDIKSGVLTTTLGAAETVFAAIPQVTAFNTGIAAIKESAKNLPEGGEKTVNAVVDFPFQAASMIVKALGYDPEDGSDAKKILEIADIVASFGTMYLIHGGGKKVSEMKSSINDLKNNVKQFVEGGISPEKINEAFVEMQDITLNDIKAAAEERGTPESKEIVDKIVDIQKENEVSPETDKVHQELVDLEAEVEKPMSDEAKQILNQKIAEKREEIATQSQAELDSHIDDSVGQVDAVERNDRVSEIDTRIDVLKGDLEVTENETVKQSLNDRISDLEAQKEELKSPVSKETKEAVKQDKLATEIEQKAAESASKVVGKIRDKSFITRLAKESSIPDNIKAEIEKKGLERIQFSNTDAQKIADTVIEDLKKDFGNDGWHDAAINFASEKKKGVPLSINAGIMGRVVGDFIDREKATDDPVEKQHYAEMSADAANLIDESALDFGRFGSMLAKVYEMSPLGIEARIKKKISVVNDAKLDESFKGGKTAREKIKELYAELEKTKLKEGSIEEQVQQRMNEIMESLPKERKSYAKKAVDALDNMEKDLLSGKLAFASVIPPPVIVAVLRTAKLLIKGGMLAHDAIFKAIEKHKSENTEDKYEFESVIPKFKEILEKAGIKDPKDKPERYSEKMSDLESFVKKVEDDFKNPKEKKVDSEVSAAEKALTDGVKLPSDYKEEVVKIKRKQADISKAINRLDKKQKLVEERELLKKYKELDKEKQVLEEALRVFDGSTIRESQVKLLDKIFPKKKIESVAKRKKLHEKILEAYNAGALDYDKFEKLFYEKFGLSDIDNVDVKEFLSKQSQRIHDAADGGLKEREYTTMLNFLEDRKKQNMSEWVTTPFYANILSGYETHLNNAQFNMWSTIAQTALLAEKNPTNARYLALQMLKAIPQGLTEGGNILKTGLKFGEPAKAESLAERRADKGPGISHYYKLPGRLLKAGDAIFNTPIKSMKRAELLLEIAKNYNKSLPESERLSKTEIEASVNDIMFKTTERKAEAYDQAVKDIQKLEGKDVDLNNPKIARDIKLRQFEIMENSRVPDKYADMNIDKDAINEEAQDFANRSLVQGKPVGSLGALSTTLHTLGDSLPLSKFMITTFIDVPLNLTNMMIDKSPLGAIRAYRGKRGLFLSEKAADKYNIKTELTPGEKKEAYIRAANYTAALIGIAALTGIKYTDDDGNERPILEITSDGTGDFRKNRNLERAYGYKEYTADFMGYKFNYKYNSILAPVFTPIGAVRDYEKYLDKSPEKEKELSARVAYGLYSHLNFIYNQSNMQWARDIFGSVPGKTIDEENWSEVLKDKFAKTVGKVIRNLAVPNFTIQANKDIKGLLEMADKKPTEAMDYLLKDVPFVESILSNKIDHLGRDVKSQASLPVFLVPDKLNLKGNDEFYNLFVDKKYTPAFAVDRKIFDGEDEVLLTGAQMDEVNRLRGRYVLKILKSEDEIKGQTYMKTLKGLDEDDFKKEMNQLFEEGTNKAKSEIIGLDVDKKLDKDAKDKRRERNRKGNQRMEKLWEIHRRK